MENTHQQFTYCPVDPVRHTFEHLRNAFPAAGIVFSSPHIFLTDFEQALIAGMQTVFPGVKHRGCHLHFTKRVWAAVQRAGLQTAYGRMLV